MATCPACGGVPAGLYQGAELGAHHAGHLVRQRTRAAAARDRAGAAYLRVHRAVEARGFRRLRWFYGQLTDAAIARAGRGARHPEELVEPGQFRQLFHRAVVPWLRHAVAAGVSVERSWIEQSTGRARMTQKASTPPPLPDITMEMPEEMQRRLWAYVDNRATLIWPTVEAGTRDRLSAELFKAVRDGEGTKGIVKRLRKVSPQLTKVSAARIARTEATGAMNFAQHQERLDAEIQHKQWIATLDGATRSPANGSPFDHLGADGQTVGNDHPFVVSGQRLLYPGDTSLGASAGNVINCRCAAAAAWPDEPLDVPPPAPPPPQTKPAPPEPAPAPQPAPEAPAPTVAPAPAPPAPRTPATTPGPAPPIVAPEPAAVPATPPKKPKLPAALPQKKLLEADPHWEKGPWGKKASGNVSYGAVLVDENGRVLLREPTNHFGGYHWTFAKGKPKAFEHPLATVLREVPEETGHIPAVIGQLPGAHSSGSSTTYFYLAKTKKLAPKLMDAETQAVRWVTLDEAEELIKLTTNAAGRARDLAILAETRLQWESLLKGSKLPWVKPHQAKWSAKAVAPGAIVPAKPEVPVPTQPIPKVTDELDIPERVNMPLPEPLEEAWKPQDLSFPTLEELTHVRRLGGSTGAELVRDGQGRLWVRKTGASADHVREEFLAEQFYRSLGVAVPESQLYEAAGGPVKLARFIDGKTLGATKGAQRKAAIERLSRDFASDALLGNWDVVGLDQDNVLVDAAGRAWRIDVGGSLRFRAMGARKTAAEWSQHATEYWTLTNTGSAAKAYGKLTAGQRLNSLELLLSRWGQMSPAVRQQLQASEVWETVSARLEVLREIRRGMREFMGDSWVVEWADRVAKHRMGQMAAGLHNALPQRLMPVLGGRPQVLVDENGREWDHLRDKGGFSHQLSQYVDKNGGRWEAVRNWADEQANSSWSEAAEAVKWLVASNRTDGPGTYWWRNGPDHAKRMLSRLASNTQGGMEVLEESMAALQAATYDTLRLVQTVNSDRRRGVLRLVRTENAYEYRSAYGIDMLPGGDPQVVARGAAESFSLAEEFYYKGDVPTVSEVPRTRVMAPYWYSKASHRPSFFAGDDENEFVVVPVGLDFQVWHRGEFNDATRYLIKHGITDGW